MCEGEYFAFIEARENVPKTLGVNDDTTWMTLVPVDRIPSL
jgi:hypothetical protein